MGNCGVGFAPAKPDKHDWLINLMEGVEDISWICYVGRNSMGMGIAIRNVSLKER